MIQILKKNFTPMAKRSVIQPSHVHIAIAKMGLRHLPVSRSKSEVSTATHGLFGIIYRFKHMA